MTRGVKSVSTDIDLSAYLKTPEQIPKPLNALTLFGRAAPLELEIGSGKGLFIRNAAARYPEHCFAGIEIGKKFAGYSANQLLQRDLRNALMICGDAAEILRDWIAEDELEAIHVYFPDPWWKRAQRKRRILRTEVLKLIESRLRRGGTLHFWTDVEEYYQSTLQLLASETTLQGPFDVTEKDAENEFDYRTHFERRTRLNGEAVFRCEFKK